MRFPFRLFPAVAALMPGVSVAHADTLVQSASTYYSYLQGPTVGGFALQRFPSQFGVLTSVSESLTGTVYFEPMTGAPVSEYVIQVGPILSNVTGTGDAVLNVSATTTT